MQFKEYRNEIPYNTLKTWSAILLEETDWKFTGWTGNPKEPYRHWAAYPEQTGLIEKIWKFLDETIREDGIFVKPERVILNLYNHGDSSWFHKDSGHHDDWTIILFLNDHWDIQWGGDFSLIEDNEIIQSFAPTPGKFIAFKSNLLHAARPVSREAPYPRFGIAFQCKHDTHVTKENTPRIRAATL